MEYFIYNDDQDDDLFGRYVSVVEIKALALLISVFTSSSHVHDLFDQFFVFKEKKRTEIGFYVFVCLK